MTAPANKKRTHNAAAREASQRIPASRPTARATPARRSRYGARLQQLRGGAA